MFQVAVRSCLLLALVGLVTPTPVFAQARLASLSGEVVDITGAALPATILTIRHESLGIEQQVTASQGTYRVDGLPPGEYQVTASSPGFTSATLRVSLSSGVARRCGSG